ncbi:MAG: carbohydrate kinase family protein [Clostridia bacterium]
MSYVSAISPLTLDLLYSGIPRVPNLGEEVFAGSFDMQIGGGPTATIITLNRLGVPTHYNTFLSDDSISSIAGALLDQHGIDYLNIYKGTHSPIVVTSIASFPEDRYFLTYNPQINTTACSDEEIYEALKGSKICIGVKGHDKVMKQLREEGTRVVFDVGWEDDLNIDNLKELLQGIDVFTPNEKEAQKLTGCSNTRDALDSISKYVEYAVITLGKEGCLAKYEGKSVQVPPIKDIQAVDTTGAGDNFLAGLIYGMYQDWSFLECLKMGNAVGAYSTTGLGCCKSVITIDKALKLMGQINI